MGSISTNSSSSCSSNISNPNISTNSIRITPTEPEKDFIKAIRGDNPSLIQEMLEKGMDVNIIDYFGRTALILAMKKGHKEIVNRLVESTPNINIIDNFGNTALIRASRRGYTEIVKLLIEAKADINIKDKNGRTALMIASIWGHEKVVKQLLDAKSNINEVDKYGYTALILAIYNQNKKVIRLLIQSGADINTTDKNGNKEVIKTVSNINAINNNECTTLFNAVFFKHIDLIKQLVQTKADINIINKFLGCTLLTHAVYRKYTEIIKQLIKLKTDIKFHDGNNDTVLIIAVQNGYKEIVMLLIEIIVAYNENSVIKLHLDTRNKYGQTALTIATECKRAEIVKRLIKANADVNAIICIIDHH